MKLPTILQKLIYMSEPDAKDFNWLQFIFSALIYFVIYTILLNFAISDCEDQINYFERLLLYLWTAIVTLHLSFYQSSNIVWDSTFFPYGPPAFPQIIVYLIFVLLPALLFGC